MACGPGGAAVRGDAGTTYYVMAFSDTVGVIGGNLVADFSALPPAPEATLTVEPRATAYKDGSLLLRGTYSCTNADGYSSDVEGTVTQTVGRLKIEGFFLVYPLECDGDRAPVGGHRHEQQRALRRRQGRSVALVVACGFLECTVTEVVQKAPGDPRRSLSDGHRLRYDDHQPAEGGGRGDQPRSPLSASPMEVVIRER